MAKVYLDMDGVLADFFGAWEEIIGGSYKEVKSAEQFSEVANKLIKGTDFFYNLKAFDHAKQLVHIVQDIFNVKPCILSTPLLGDISHTVDMKTKWLKDNIGLENLDELIFTHDKHAYADNNILIDDYLPNLTRWAKTGGIAIKYKANSNKYKFEDLIKTMSNAKILTDIGMRGQVLFIR